MAKLNQIIAIEKSVKSQSFQELTEAHQSLQKPALLAGISRTYRPKDEEGEQLPPESTRVQLKAQDVIRETTASLTRLFDVTATKDWANCVAKADVVVDGRTLLRQVPATYLLFLEKQLVDLHTFVKKLPVLDASEAWSFDASTGRLCDGACADAQDEEDAAQPCQGGGDREASRAGRGVLRGRHCRLLAHGEILGALPAQRGNELLPACERLQEAVKFAREEANSIEVEDQKVGAAFFDYLFGA